MWMLARIKIAKGPLSFCSDVVEVAGGLGRWRALRFGHASNSPKILKAPTWGGGFLALKNSTFSIKAFRGPGGNQKEYLEGYHMKTCPLEDQMYCTLWGTRMYCFHIFSQK
jgi:hypothetical protein